MSSDGCATNTMGDENTFTTGVNESGMLYCVGVPMAASMFMAAELNNKV